MISVVHLVDKVIVSVSSTLIRREEHLKPVQTFERVFAAASICASGQMLPEFL